MKVLAWLSKQWQWVRQPTLARRSAITVLASFTVIWAVLLAYQYYKVTSVQSTGQGMRNYGEAMLAAVNQFAQADQAAEHLRATEQFLNTRRKQIGILPGELTYELQTLQGQIAYQSKALPPLGSVAKQGVMTMIEHKGRQYAVYQGLSDKWVLTVVEPRRTDSEFLLFNAKELLPFLLLALPFVVAPLWWSMHHGLRPLRQLAERIGKRTEADLSPIGFHTKHAEIKPLEHALDDLLLKLRERLARERAFVQDAAHELRTPLAVMAAQAHAMARTEDATARAQSQAHLEQAIERASHVSSQLLSLAAMDEAAAQPTQTIDLAHWVRQQLAALAQSAISKDIDLSLDAPDSLIRTVDLAALESVLSNLVDNAIRYGHSGGNVVVTLRAAGSQSSGFELIVSDDGPGISEADRERVFERFYRVPGQTESGSGLGLAIVLQAARRMGGRIKLGAGSSDQGLSARFVVASLDRD
jgi:two-component system, OmpR family, sensor histidine kinase QseC